MWKKIDGVYLGVVVFFYLVFFFTTYSSIGDWATSALVSLGISSFLFIVIRLNDYYGKRKHRSILESSVFLPLKRELGFQIEELNEGNYSGYKGMYNKYFFRIYYNWDTVFSTDYIWREYCVMIYFEPLMNSEGEFDIARLDELNKSYKRKNFMKGARQRIIFEVSHIRLHNGFFFFTRYRHIRKKIDLLIEIAKTEGLKPISESEVKKLLEEDPYLHGPSVETFYDEED